VALRKVDARPAGWFGPTFTELDGWQWWFPFFHTPNFVLISVGTRPNYSPCMVRSYLGAMAGAAQLSALGEKWG
jgi:hypothetical protein